MPTKSNPVSKFSMDLMKINPLSTEYDELFPEFNDNDMEEMKEAKCCVVYDTPKVNTKRGKAASFPVIQHKKTQPFVNACRKLQFESECDIISEKQDIEIQTVPKKFRNERTNDTKNKNGKGDDIKMNYIKENCNKLRSDQIINILQSMQKSTKKSSLLA